MSMNLADIILSAGRCQTEEEADIAISAMLSPVPNRRMMGDTFVTVLGYNPITYFSENEIRDMVNKILKDNDSLNQYLQDEDIDSEKIISMAMSIHLKHIERDQVLSIKEAIWALCPTLPSSISDDLKDIYVPADEYDNPCETYDEDEDDDDLVFEEIEEEDDDE